MWTRSRCSRPFDRRPAEAPMRSGDIADAGKKCRLSRSAGTDQYRRKVRIARPVPERPRHLPKQSVAPRQERRNHSKCRSEWIASFLHKLSPLPCSIILQFSTSFADFDFARNSHPESPGIKIIPFRYEIPRPPIRTARSGQEARLPAGKAVRRQRRFRWRSPGR